MMPPGPQDFLQIFPGVVHIFHRRHIGHGAAGGDVGQDDALLRPGQDAGGFGHKMDAAEDDEIGLGAAGGLLRQQERVALEIGVFDDFFALVMMPQDGHPAAQLPAGGADALIQLGGVEVQIGRGELLPAHIGGHFFGQGLGGQFVFGLAERRMFVFGDGDDRRAVNRSHHKPRKQEWAAGRLRRAVGQDCRDEGRE